MAVYYTVVSFSVIQYTVKTIVTTIATLYTIYKVNGGTYFTQYIGPSSITITVI